MLKEMKIIIFKLLIICKNSWEGSHYNIIYNNNNNKNFRLKEISIMLTNHSTPFNNNKLLIIIIINNNNNNIDIHKMGWIFLLKQLLQILKVDLKNNFIICSNNNKY